MFNITAVTPTQPLNGSVQQALYRKGRLASHKNSDARNAFNLAMVRNQITTALQFLLEHGHFLSDLLFNSCCTRDQGT